MVFGGRADSKSAIFIVTRVDVVKILFWHQMSRKLSQLESYQVVNAGPIVIIPFL